MLPTEPPPRYGFVGVGTMSSAIVRGMCTLSALPMTSIVLSPRGAEKAATLKAQGRILDLQSAILSGVGDRSPTRLGTHQTT